MKTTGDIDSQAAAFIYKDDSSQNSAWESVLSLDPQDGTVRGELHNKKDEFLDGLWVWNAGVGPQNAFLVVYAHMGPDGLCFLPCEGCPYRISHSHCLQHLVKWQEFADALPLEVAHLWLLGCDSEKCMTAWNPLVGPVRNCLLVTTKEKYWAPLLKTFRLAISLDPITYDDELPRRIRTKHPCLGWHTRYFRVNEDRNDFVQVR